MFWLKNELTKTIENGILNGSAVYSHMVTREMEDISNAIEQQNKMIQKWQHQCLKQTAAFWSFWCPIR